MRRLIHFFSDGARWAAAAGLLLAGLTAAPPVSQAAAVPCQDLINDGGFEGTNSFAWTDTSLPEDLPSGDPWYGPFIPVTISLSETVSSGFTDIQYGVNDPAGPAAGDWWAWFGKGYTSTVAVGTLTQIISQPVTIPYTATLNFDLWISRADAGSGVNDRLEALVNGVTVFSVTAPLSAPYASGYQPVRIDLDLFNIRSVTTTLTISATTQVGHNQLPPVVNFNVDNIHVCGGDAVSGGGGGGTWGPPTNPVYLPLVTKKLP